MLRRTIPSRLGLPFTIVRLASFVVPIDEQADWIREWRAELWHREQTLEGQGTAGLRCHRLLLSEAFGAFRDAHHLWRERCLPQLLQRYGLHQASPQFCLLAIASGIAGMALLSGGLPATRSLIHPLPYPKPHNVAIVAEGSWLLAARSPTPVQWIAFWQHHPGLIESAAGYSWADRRYSGSAATRNVRTADVDLAFFPLLAARTRDGQRIDASLLRSCSACVFVSHSFWQAHPAERTVVIDGASYQVAGVLHPEFWFLDPSIAVWRWSNSQTLPPRAGAVIRIADGVSTTDAETELARGLTAAGLMPETRSLIVRRVADVIGAPLVCFLFAAGLALLLVIAASQGNYSAPSLFVSHTQRAVPHRFYWFFIAKVALALLSVMIAGLEFTRAGAVNILGGSDLTALPLTIWLWLAMGAGTILWAVADQSCRCRTCLQKLGMPTKIGCPGCMLLDWSGTELVCAQGHGILHVADTAPCWDVPYRWTPLDESWTELFDNSTSA